MGDLEYLTTRQVKNRNAKAEAMASVDEVQYKHVKRTPTAAGRVVGAIQQLGSAIQQSPIQPRAEKRSRGGGSMLASDMFAAPKMGRSRGGVGLSSDYMATPKGFSQGRSSVGFSTDYMGKKFKPRW